MEKLKLILCWIVFVGLCSILIYAMVRSAIEEYREHKQEKKYKQSPELKALYEERDKKAEEVNNASEKVDSLKHTIDKLLEKYKYYPKEEREDMERMAENMRKDFSHTEEQLMVLFNDLHELNQRIYEKKGEITFRVRFFLP